MLHSHPRPMSGRGAPGVSVPAPSTGGEGAHVLHKQLSTQYLAQGQSGMAYGTLVDLWQHAAFSCNPGSKLPVSADASAIASAAMMTGTSGLYQLECRADGAGAGGEDVR